MASLPVTISGVAYPKNKKDPPIPVTIVGVAWITGLKIDNLPPITPTDPPSIWPPGTGIGDYIDNSLPLPQPPPDQIPNPPEAAKPPPPGGGWGWSPELGWIYFPGSGSPGPKSNP